MIPAAASNSSAASSSISNVSININTGRIYQLALDYKLGRDGEIFWTVSKWVTKTKPGFFGGEKTYGEYETTYFPIMDEVRRQVGEGTILSVAIDWHNRYFRVFYTKDK